MIINHNNEQGKGSVGLIAGVAIVGVLAGAGFFMMNAGQEPTVEEPVPLAEKAESQEAPTIEQEEAMVGPAVKSTAENQKVVDEVEGDLVDQDALDEQEREANAMEIQYLKEVLPNNVMIPVEKTPQEVDELFAHMEEQQKLEQKIAEKKATKKERERYFELRSQQYEDEIEIINLCTETLASSDPAVPKQGLCANAVDAGPDRLKEIEVIMGELRGQYLTSE